MSETITSQGHEEMPSLHIDSEYTIHKLSEATPERLCELQTLYTDFLSSDPMKHHAEQAERFLTHVDFEQRYRAGEFN